ncbi:hypothetical protein Krac_5493 [Ktedonobacter racemifer DSM 44963]|uniref:Uncharacterized protein n=1 Tax=Ktedonobacter racemifer DSM 44963 TaxID=485913 RepID=D6TW67_KTERA|nr:hypothetical protein Krac_5493 [Ktedonobacter racemifer DSM 44963]
MRLTVQARFVGGADRKGPAVVPRWQPTLRQVNRLKLIKLQMYGRANFDLLLLRILYHDEAFHTKCA